MQVLSKNTNIKSYIPGLILTIILAILSQNISNFVGIKLLNFTKSPISSVMVVVILGILLKNTTKLSNIFSTGIQFSVKKLLKLGIILLGIRLNLGEIFEIGFESIFLVSINIVIALSLISFLVNKFNINNKLGTLIGVGTAICGVTAIVTVGPLIDAEEDQTAYSIAVISIFGLMATIIYPYIAHSIFPLDPTLAGIFLGSSIHDTSQVTGAALIYAETFDSIRALDAATVTKLIRNISMVFVIPYISWKHNKTIVIDSVNEKKGIAWLKHIPTFVIWFVGFSILRWIGDVQLSNQNFALWIFNANNWELLIQSLLSVSKFLMLMALAGVGLNTQLKKLAGTGIKPLLIGFISASVIGLFSATFLLLK